MLTSDTETIKSGQLIPETAELGEYSPKSKREDDNKTVVFDYSFASDQITNLFSGSSGASFQLPYTINFTPKTIRIGGLESFFPSVVNDKYNLDNFIGILSEKESEDMKKEIGLLRKNIDDSFDARKILFGK